MDEFLEKKQLDGPPAPTYEEWIGDLHPENAKGKRANAADKLDHRCVLSILGTRDQVG